MTSFGLGQATHEEICDSALRQYERIAKEACDWCSTVPRAIEFYKKHGPEEPKGKPKSCDCPMLTDLCGAWQEHTEDCKREEPEKKPCNEYCCGNWSKEWPKCMDGPSCPCDCHGERPRGCPYCSGECTCLPCEPSPKPKEEKTMDSVWEVLEKTGVEERDFRKALLDFLAALVYQTRKIGRTKDEKTLYEEIFRLRSRFL